MREVPPFAPLRLRGGRVRGALRRGRNRRTVAAGLAMAAAALATAGPHGFASAGRAEGDHRDSAPGGRSRPDLELVRAPVRIADAETVRLLRPGDRVDVISAPASGADASRVVAGARVSDVTVGEGPPGQDGPGQDGALLVLSVPRAAAAELAGASLNSRLAVVVC
ncbi:hypothetical protein [Streptomyces boluensis]|uniref:Flp pilus assembly protein RcpC/CpaB domain-containing protein n=1 Tax=Streptomyces boluensis TaxID=1775135 RepID=A0A964UYE7_9ACTN|nr:hypothetical protein [Streptomyces boluensis]NBE57012.1 hypothetical protein [Streptomyces boluensis]